MYHRGLIAALRPRGLLINGALGEPFVPFREQLWCDRAVAANVPCEPADSGDLPACTRATTGSAGWVWEIPRQHRWGDGYVYSSAHLSPDEAEAEVRAFLGVSDSAPVRRITIRTGKSRRTWVGHCVAVGLAGGFIEPLESTGIGLIQDIGEFFIHYAPDLAWGNSLAAKPNSFMDASYDFIRDFVACHYATAARDDTPFWRDVTRDPAVRTPLLAEVLDQCHRGQFRGVSHADGARPAFRPYSWAYIIGGNGLRPERAAGAAVDEAVLAQAQREWAAKAEAIAAVVPLLPDHRERVTGLRQAWERGDRPRVEADPSAYAGLPHQLQTGYLSGAADTPLAPPASQRP